MNPVTKSHKHHVQFVAEEKVSEPAHIQFFTKKGQLVSFDGHEKIKERVKVAFMARNKK